MDTSSPTPKPAPTTLSELPRSVRHQHMPLASHVYITPVLQCTICHIVQPFPPKKNETMTAMNAKELASSRALLIGWRIKAEQVRCPNCKIDKEAPIDLAKAEAKVLS